MHSLDRVLAIILGGGVGRRLYPLTRLRAKPAVPIAGKYRLIDVPISNCINSGIHHIAVLTQFNSVSLHRHITQTYSFDAFHRGWVDILAAEQTPASTDWYQGTADAVRKQLFEIKTTGATHVLILAGDHLYRMDYAALAQYHWKNRAEITVAVQPVPEEGASRFGLLQRNPQGRITSFVEKPNDPQVFTQFATSGNPQRPFLASMGIYMFKTNVLIDLLENSTYDDFGGQIIPNALQTHTVYGFDFDGYWEDIGTIRSFYETNLSLTRPNPPFTLYDPLRPIYTRPRFLPGVIIDGATLHNVLLADGSILHRAEINDSIIGLRSQICDDVRISNSIIMGADFYKDPNPSPDADIPLGIGKGCQIEGAIIDKNVRMGEGVVIRPFSPGVDRDEGDWVVQDGIVVVPKSTQLRPGTYIGPDS
ncbi:MAG: glucose-1-phosphate adenylyltransferase [Anaerolineales bacterium]|nr:glucose-1-phosphate adenylyltransferase [Anaerolineales bacterium]